MSNSKKIIFLNSYLPRTGHNFASEVIKVFSDHKVLAHSRSETRLSTMLESYYSIYNREIYFDSDKKFFNDLFINDLRRKITETAENEYIMIKDTSLIGVNHITQIFPEDLHLILVRDPKSVFLSLLKSINLEKPTWKNKIKKWSIPFGLYPFYYSKKLSRKVLSTMPDLSDHTIIRYEDLVKKDDNVLRTLKKTFATSKSLDLIKKEIDEIHVINSSFYKEVQAKHIWEAKPKTKSFNPLNRKANNFLIKTGVELGSRKFRKKLNYL